MRKKSKKWYFSVVLSALNKTFLKCYKENNRRRLSVHLQLLHYSKEQRKVIFLNSCSKNVLGNWSLLFSLHFLCLCPKTKNRYFLTTHFAFFFFFSQKKTKTFYIILCSKFYRICQPFESFWNLFGRGTRDGAVQIGGEGAKKFFGPAHLRALNLIEGNPGINLGELIFRLKVRINQLYFFDILGIAIFILAFPSDIW